jgi:myo-inositol 2-dehydrogenase/D-chiro-inositol 1-dehydrogenase
VTDPLRIGVAGCGALARYVHIRSLSAIRGAAVAAIADDSAAALAAAARLAPAAARFPSVEEMLAAGLVDAVVVSTPSASHARPAELVLGAGLALYLEKPIATTLEEGESLVAQAAGVDVVAATGFNRRFHPVFAELRRIVLSGAIGRCRLVRTAFCEPIEPEQMPGWKRARDTGGGAIIDLASHHVDLLRWITGEEPRTVYASVLSERTEHDVSRLRIAMSGDVDAETFVSFRSARMDAVEVIGERGVVRADRYARNVTATVTSTRSHSARRIRRMPTPALAVFRGLAVIRPAREPSYRSCLRSFVRAIGGPRDPELATLEDGLRSLAVVLAAEDSARLDRSVEIA